MARLRFATPALLFLLAGCPEGLLGPGHQPLDFSWSPAGHGEWLEEPEVVAGGGEGTIQVEARLSAPNPCQSLTGQAERSGQDWVLRVRIVGGGGACTAQIGTFEYLAVIGDLPADEYSLQVVHEYPGTGWVSGPVLEERIPVR